VEGQGLQATDVGFEDVTALFHPQEVLLDERVRHVVVLEQD